MRKLLPLTILSLIVSVFAHAQISKGSVLLGGNFSAGKSQYSSSANDNESSQRSFNFAPTLGWATKENTVWGFNLGFNHSKSKSIHYPEKQQGSGYSAGLFFRKYATLGKGFYLFGQANAGYNQWKQEEAHAASNYSRVSKSRSIGISAYPGITYAVGKRFHVEVGLNELVSLGYSKYDIKTSQSGTESTTKSSGFSISTSFSNSNPFNVGFRFLIGK